MKIVLDFMSTNADNSSKKQNETINRKEPTMKTSTRFETYRIQLPTEWTTTKDVAEFNRCNVDTARRYLNKQACEGDLLKKVDDDGVTCWKTPSNSEGLNFTIPTEWTSTLAIARLNDMKASDTICMLCDYKKDGLVVMRVTDALAPCSTWKKVVKTYRMNNPVDLLQDRDTITGVAKARADLDVRLSSEWCVCAEESLLCYPEDGACDCGIVRHHVHCNCGKVTQIG